jgi:uncharacterized membrane protein YdbT with pleckstrin-like domain
MGYVERNLIPGEQVLYKTGLHWIVLFGLVLFGFFFCGLGFGLVLLISAVISIIDESASSGAMTPGEMAKMGLFFLAVGAIPILLGHFARKATEIAVTNKRIVIRTGLVSRRTYELLLSKVESIGVEDGIWGRMLGYGSVVVHGAGGTPDPFNRVAHPFEFRRQVQQQIEEREQK